MLAAGGDRGHVIVPAKGFLHGKSRLAAHLDAENLQALNLRNAERTLHAAAEFFGPARCVLVSPCPLTCGTVRRMGFRALFQEHNDGLNAGLELARACLRREGARTLTVLPVDLPCISNAALRAVLGLAIGPRLAAIVPDVALQGTNLLSAPADFPFSFRFGPASFGAHLAQLRLGLEVHVAQPCALQLDLDTIEQLHLLRGGRGINFNRLEQTMTVAVTDTLDFPIESAWKMISDFGALMQWHPQVLACEVRGAGVGSERLVKLDGRWARERLDVLDEDRHILQYTVTEASDPRSVGVTGSIQLTSAGPGRTMISWTSGLPDTHAQAAAVNGRLAAYYPTRIGHLKAALAQQR